MLILNQYQSRFELTLWFAFFYMVIIADVTNNVESYVKIQKVTSIPVTTSGNH